jgi:hypothetical protein
LLAGALTKPQRELQLVQRNVLQHNLLDLVERDLVVTAIVKFRGPGALVRRHLLRVLEHAIVLARSLVIASVTCRPFGIRGLAA